MTETYRCEACGGEFNEGWSDAEAVAEAEQTFGERPDTHDMAKVCDKCYREMLDLPPEE